MGITVYSLLWVMQDFVHQPYQVALRSEIGNCFGFYMKFGRTCQTNTLNPKLEAVVPDPQVGGFGKNTVDPKLLGLMIQSPVPVPGSWRTIGTCSTTVVFYHHRLVSEHR